MRVACVALLALCSCFKPHITSGQLVCSSEGRCPDGFSCMADRCWAAGDGPDLGAASDMTDEIDMTVPPMVVTAHDIDSGTLANNTVVSVANLVVVGPTEISKKVVATLRCQYKARLQDATQPAPNGIQVFMILGNCAPADGGDCTCPSTTGTPLDALVTIGDVFTLTGTYSTFGTMPVTHELTTLTSAVKTGSGVSVSATVVTDASQLAPSAAGFTSYEGMLVKLAPAGGIVVSGLDAFGDFSGAGVKFSGDYGATYEMGGTFPLAGATYDSITAVIDNNFNGSLVPRMRSDFSP